MQFTDTLQYPKQVIMPPALKLHYLTATYFISRNTYQNKQLTAAICEASSINVCLKTNNNSDVLFFW